MKKIEDISDKIGYGLRLIKLEDIDDITKLSLVEKNIISPEFANKSNNNTGILINNEENICIMINEEDHIRIQVFSEGLDIKELKKLAVEIDQKIENLLNYSFSNKYGYLTACPTNVGTGMRISTMVHLPALTHTNNMEKILRIVNNFGMSVRGIYGEGSKSVGDIYQISNNQTLGVTEEEIERNVETITEKVIEQERIARKYLGKNGIELENKLYKSFGILLYSRIITYNECINLLSDVKLGTDMGIIKELDDKKIKKLWLYTRPGNLQKYYGETLTSREQSIKRSELVNQIINEK